MSDTTHIHDNKLIKDVDDPFIIDTTTRAISSGTNKKLSLMQFDHNSERYTFKINRYVDEHDLLDCNRVQIHFINIASNKQRHPGLYPVDKLEVDPNDENTLTFTWLISRDATFYKGTLSFLVSFECVDKNCTDAECNEDDHIYYRWSSNVFNSIAITEGMDNNNTIYDMYADELLTWQNYMQTEYIPDLVDKCYVERVFATPEEVASIFGISEL